MALKDSFTKMTTLEAQRRTDIAPELDKNFNLIGDESDIHRNRLDIAEPKIEQIEEVLGQSVDEETGELITDGNKVVKVDLTGNYERFTPVDGDNIFTKGVSGTDGYFSVGDLRQTLSGLRFRGTFSSQADIPDGLSNPDGLGPYRNGDFTFIGTTPGTATVYYYSNFVFSSFPPGSPDYNGFYDSGVAPSASVDYVLSLVGNLSGLITTDKSNLVNAINETFNIAIYAFNSTNANSNSINDLEVVTQNLETQVNINTNDIETKLNKDFRTLVAQTADNIETNWSLAVTTTTGENFRVLLADLISIAANPNNKGTFDTVAELKAQWPDNISNPSDRSGWFAFVRETDSTWRWSVASNAWEEGEVFNGVTQEELNAVVAFFNSEISRIDIEIVSLKAKDATFNTRITTLEQETIKVSEKGQPGGIATLDDNGKVVQEQLPVDIRIETLYANYSVPGDINSNGILQLEKPLDSAIETVRVSNVSDITTTVAQFERTLENSGTIANNATFDVSSFHSTTSSNRTFVVSYSLLIIKTTGEQIPIFANKQTDQYAGNLVNFEAKLTSIDSDLETDLDYIAGDRVIFIIRIRTISGTGNITTYVGNGLRDTKVSGNLSTLASNRMIDTTGVIDGILTNSLDEHRRASDRLKQVEKFTEMTQTVIGGTDFTCELEEADLSNGKVVWISFPQGITGGDGVRISIDNGVTFNELIFPEIGVTLSATILAGQYVNAYFDTENSRWIVWNSNETAKFLNDRINGVDYGTLPSVVNLSSSSLSYIDALGRTNHAPLKVDPSDTNLTLVSGGFGQPIGQGQTQELELTINSGDTTDFVKNGNGIQINNNNLESVKFEFKDTDLIRYGTTPTEGIDDGYVQLYRDNVAVTGQRVLIPGGTAVALVPIIGEFTINNPIVGSIYTVKGEIGASAITGAGYQFSQKVEFTAIDINGTQLTIPEEYTEVKTSMFNDGNYTLADMIARGNTQQDFENALYDLYLTMVKDNIYNLTQELPTNYYNTVKAFLNSQGAGFTGNAVYVETSRNTNGRQIFRFHDAQSAGSGVRWAYLHMNMGFASGSRYKGLQLFNNLTNSKTYIYDKTESVNLGSSIDITVPFIWTDVNFTISVDGVGTNVSDLRPAIRFGSSSPAKLRNVVTNTYSNSSTLSSGNSTEGSTGTISDKFDGTISRVYTGTGTYLSSIFCNTYFSPYSFTTGATYIGVVPIVGLGNGTILRVENINQSGGATTNQLRITRIRAVFKGY